MHTARCSDRISCTGGSMPVEWVSVCGGGGGCPWGFSSRGSLSKVWRGWVYVLGVSVWDGDCALIQMILMKLLKGSLITKDQLIKYLTSFLVQFYSLLWTWIKNADQIELHFNRRNYTFMHIVRFQ